MSAAGSHEWAGNGYHCATCGGSYHCPHCSDSCSMMGHQARDADGFFATCQDPERAARWRDQFFKAKR